MNTEVFHERPIRTNHIHKSHNSHATDDKSYATHPFMILLVNSQGWEQVKKEVHSVNTL